jgi:hypothetical protein
MDPSPEDGMRKEIVPSLAFLVFCILLCGCFGGRSNPNQIQFVLPDGFRGAFAVKPNDPDGILLSRISGQYILTVPEDGVLRIRGYDPFESYLSTASFATNGTIWVERWEGDRPTTGQVGLWGGHTCIEWVGNDQPSCTFWWFIGTDEEWTESSDEARHSPGTILKNLER